MCCGRVEGGGGDLYCVEGGMWYVVGVRWEHSGGLKENIFLLS